MSCFQSTMTALLLNLMPKPYELCNPLYVLSGHGFCPSPGSGTWEDTMRPITYATSEIRGLVIFCNLLQASAVLRIFSTVSETLMLRESSLNLKNVRV